MSSPADPSLGGCQQCVTGIVSSQKTVQNVNSLFGLIFYQSTNVCKEIDFYVSSLCNLFVPEHSKSNEAGL